MTLRVLYSVFLAVVVTACDRAQENTATSPQVSEEIKAEVDHVFFNGRIYTMNANRPWAEAVAVKDGRFVAVGSNASFSHYLADGIEHTDLQGRFVMPGIIDAHVHPYDVYINKYSGALLFSDQIGPEEIAKEISQYAKANPDKAWIKGSKYGLGAFPGGKMTRQWLDKIVSDRPVYIWDETGHNATANSKALALAGVDKNT